MDKIGDIRSAVNKFRNDTNFQALRTRWNKDFDLWQLKPYNAGTGYYSYTSNAPRNLAKKAISMIAEAKLLIRIPEELLREDERHIASNVERFMHGSLTLQDERLARIPDTPLLRSQMAWYIAIRGGFAIRPYVYKDKDGSTIVDYAVWDIYNTSYGRGSKGTAWAVHSRVMDREAILAEYDYDIQKKEDTLYDFWDEKNNGVFVGDKWLKPLEPHGLDYCPVFIIRSGDQPMTSQENTTRTNATVGESIFDANRNIYPVLNKTLSDWQTIIRRGVKVPLGYWSAGGEKQLEGDIYQVERGSTIPLDSLTQEKIEPLIEPTVPKDTGDFINIVSSEEQRGGMSHVAQGELGFRLSGFAINQLQAQLATVIIPLISAIERGLSVSLLSALEQYSKKSWKPIGVRGRTSRNQIFGVPKAVEIRPKDLEGDWHPEITLLPQMPKDDAQRHELARLARIAGTLSLDTIQGDILGIDDPLLEQEKLRVEWAGNLPIIKLLDAFEAALAQNDMEKAYALIAELRMYMVATGRAQAGGGQGGGGFGALDMMTAQNAGMGAPTDGTGMSPEVYPPEMSGGAPAGAQGAQMPMFGEEV